MPRFHLDRSFVLFFFTLGVGSGALAAHVPAWTRQARLSHLVPRSPDPLEPVLAGTEAVLPDTLDTSSSPLPVVAPMAAIPHSIVPNAAAALETIITTGLLTAPGTVAAAAASIPTTGLLTAPAASEVSPVVEATSVSVTVAPSDASSSASEATSSKRGSRSASQTSASISASASADSNTFELSRTVTASVPTLSQTIAVSTSIPSTTSTANSGARSSVPGRWEWGMAVALVGSVALLAL